ncbi:low molecular weight protein-tyrosine-phosphatase [Motiliproteus sp. SC1-56]|uniref:low molecular weight protein-tyrosine-phosphatase n=1 Tax=Motiliproteus sp. SC1-56 TaxID=2799565 RepID=UPI001A8DC2BF|nr:low molecular weight protein-tyrosine-phosphatase [Motiliproteus sp. SC1-56]
MTTGKALSVLFVCLGNICRSPTAHGVFLRLIEEAGLEGRVAVDSAGTAAYHIGKAPDPRTREAAVRRGYDLSALRARQVEPEDFQRFDYILAMDNSNLADLRDLAPAGGRARVQLFLEFAGSGAPSEVPDPYYGGADGFDQVLDLVEGAARGLLVEINQRLQRL